MTAQKNIEAKMLRILGMEEERRAEITALNEKFDDWHGRCKSCGKCREGTLAELRAPCGCEVHNGATS